MRERFLPLVEMTERGCGPEDVWGGGPGGVSRCCGDEFDGFIGCPNRTSAHCNPCHFDRREKANPRVDCKEKSMARDHRYFVYVLTNWNDKVMYVGMTNDLVRRLWEHKTGAVKGFTEKYNVHKLVYFEETPVVDAAIAREKEIKKWRREKKNALVIRANPQWRDLSADLGLFSVIPSGARNPGID